MKKKKHTPEELDAAVARYFADLKKTCQELLVEIEEKKKLKLEEKVKPKKK